MNYRILAAFLLFALTASAQDKPVPAAEAPGKMTLPPGFKATLFAGEPDVVQPIAFTFDDRGRMWVVECLSYPKWRHDGKGSDRVTMFEDTDGDGKHDVRQVVINNGANLSGIELGFGGIWLCSSPNLIFIPCDFNADKPTPKGEPQIVLDGWNIKDTKHNIFNSLTWGPDGWLYGLNGIQAKAKVGAPGVPDKERVEMNCGVWRYHPTRKKFEAVAHGTTNPFGMDFDQDGEIFITNCVIKHLFHVVPGGHYDRMYGQDINPHSYGLMSSCADYIHWAGGDWTTSRGNKPEHSDAGGGHAHSGCMIYLGDNFPDEYRNSLFTCNIHGARLNRDILKRHGSGYKSERAKDFMFANDPWFRGIAVHYGPDGGVFVSDWCDTGECHNYEVVDATNGRIHKITYGTPKQWKGDLSKLTESELIELQKHKNEWFVNHARRVILERAHLDKLSPGFLDQLARTVKASSDPTITLRTSWVFHALSDRRATSLLFRRNEPELASWRWRTKLEQKADDVAAAGVRIEVFEEPAATPGERLAIASGLRRFPADRRSGYLRLLLDRLKPDDANDPNLPLMVWYAIEPSIDHGREQALNYLRAAKIPLVREYITRRLVELDRSYLPVLSMYAASAKEVAMTREILQGMLDGLGGRREVPLPTNWTDIAPTLLASKDRGVRDRAKLLAVAFGDEAAISSMKKTAADKMAEPEARVAAIRSLLRRGKPDIVPMLQSLVSDRAVRVEAIRGLAAFENAETSALLLRTYPDLTEAEREDAVQTLASRASWALDLLASIESGSVPRKDVSVFVARQMQGLKDKRVADRLAKVWGQLQPASAQRAALTAKYKGLLTDSELAKADQSKGRAAYVKNCAACHKLYDDGGDIGPALTGAQRSNLDYVLENVLDPSAVVPREYQVVVIDLNNGRRINGIVRNETPQAVTVRTTNETLVIPVGEIDSRATSKLSMMPEGLFDKMTDIEVRDLVAYLRSRQQVPLPK